MSLHPAIDCDVREEEGAQNFKRLHIRTVRIVKYFWDILSQNSSLSVSILRSAVFLYQEIVAEFC